MTTVSLTTTDLAKPGGDALIIATANSGPRRQRANVVSSGLRASALKRLEEALDALGATGKRDDVVRIPGASITDADVIVAVGLGKPDPDGYSSEALRRAAGNAARALTGSRRAAVALPISSTGDLTAVAEGLILGGYDFTKHRVDSMKGRKSALRAAAIVVADARDAGARAALAEAQAVANAVNLARDLVNTSPLDLYPATLADAAREAADGLPIEIEVLDEKALKAQGFGGLIGVGQGSSRGPRLIRLSYRPEGAVAHLALVGKGITFDTGGISIKPSTGMHAMKSDMGGAAAVIAATTAIARIGLPVAVTTYAASAENMPSDTAQRPGDVITIYGGKTVEVLDTDAEGRLVLADALVRAQEDKPDVIIDVATLTGAQIVALGNRTSGIMSNDDDTRAAVHAASETAGEPMWPMPLPEEIRSGYESLVADLTNLSKPYRCGGMLAAGIFLKEFVADNQRWAHLDIAGPAYNDDGPYGYTPSGGTGAAVRTFVQYARDLASG